MWLNVAQNLSYKILVEDIKEILKKSDEVLILAKHVTNLEPAKEHEIIRAKPVIRHNTITGLLSNFHSLTSDDFDDTVRSKSLRSSGFEYSNTVS